MKAKKPSKSLEIAELKEQLAEARETLRAIRSGEVDALVVNDEKGERIFTLKSADQPYRIMVETMNEGAATIRSDGVIFYCNSRFADLLNFPLERLIGSSIYGFILQKDILSFQKLMKKTRGNCDFSLMGKGGVEIATQISMSPVIIEETSGVCIIATDLSTQKLVQDQLRISRDLLDHRVRERTAELAEAVKVRDDFLSIASHELKTPLTSLKLQAQIRKYKISKRDFSYFEYTKLEKMVNDDERQINRLTRLVDDMLDLSRLSTGKLSLEFEEVDICQVVSEVVNRFAPQFQVSEIQLDVKAPQPIIGKWDRYRIEQIFANLLTNALKYGDHKPVEVCVDSNKKAAKLVVRDHGIGIAKKDQSRIFKQFERAVSVKEVSGLGLGLYIARQLVESHGGQIQVESEKGRGSTFTVRLPLSPEGKRSSQKGAHE